MEQLKLNSRMKDATIFDIVKYNRKNDGLLIMLD